MKTGDLVTISAYGRGLVSVDDQLRMRLMKLRRAIDSENPADVPEDRLPPLVGIVIKIWKGNHQWSRLEYRVSWAGQGIPGRSRWEKSFTRKDLKMVSKA
jgi:hypothetical protein